MTLNCVMADILRYYTEGVTV